MIKNSRSKLVSVIFPTLDREKALIFSLKDILAQNYQRLEIIVADQTEVPSKKVLEFCEIHRDKIKYLHLKEKGSPNARNVAVKEAKGEILFFFDDDIKIENSDLISDHLKNYEDVKVGLVGGRVLDDLDAKPSGDATTGRLKFWGLKKITHFDSTKRQEIDHAPGGNMSVKKSIFKKVGGYKTLYPGNAHLEETDFSLRVKRAGYKLVFEPKAVLRHLHFVHGGNRVKDIYALRYWIAHNYIIFELENYGKLPTAILAVRQICWGLLSSIKRGELKMFKTMFSATINGYRYYRKQVYTKPTAVKDTDLDFPSEEIGSKRSARL